MTAVQSCPGFVHAASVLPKFLTASAASLLLAKQALKPPTPGESHAATVEHAMKQNVSGCELQTHATGECLCGAGRLDGACDATPTGAARSVPVGNHGDNLNFVTVPA